MQSETHIRLFRNDGSQVVRIPREFELDGDEAIVRREGSRLIIEPVQRDGLLTVLAKLTPIEEDFADMDESLPALDDVEY